MSKYFQIAIDGPSGAGKSTIARKLAATLKIDYIDTGAMYRAVAYKVISEKIDINNKTALKAILDGTEIDLDNGRLLLNGKDISRNIRKNEISKMASRISTLPAVREKLVALQQDMGKSKSVIVDGRDIGTNVFPEAEYKFFLTAKVEERARRRWKELVDKGQEIDLATVEEDIKDRDFIDSTRELNPLKKAEDAIELDTTYMNIDEVVQKILDHFKGKATE